jgi:hypothetical protein
MLRQAQHDNELSVEEISDHRYGALGIRFNKTYSNVMLSLSKHDSGFVGAMNHASTGSA